MVALLALSTVKPKYNCYLPRESQLRCALEECDVKASALPFAALPTPGQCITNLQYAEGAAKYLGVDSPLCVGRVGQSIAGKKHRNSGAPWEVDRYGNNIFSVPLEDQYRTRHDGVKLVIPRVARWAGVRCIVEVYGHFAGLLSQDALEALDTNRKRQGLVPDFLLQGQVTGIAELKMISSVPSHYPRKIRGPNQDVRPVDVKANSLQEEYEAKLWDADPTGRAVARLQDHGPVRALVVGAFARSVAIPWVRRQIAVAAMKRQADALINGLAFCGPGGAEAYARRDTAQWKDKAARAQMEAADYAAMHRKHGRGWVDHADWGWCEAGG